MHKKTFAVFMTVAIGGILILLLSDAGRKSGNPLPQPQLTAPLIEALAPIDTAEQHFPCTIVEYNGRDESGLHAYTTECGILFYSQKRYGINDTLNIGLTKHQ